MGYSNVKQVIVLRGDLKMKKGKLVAQGSHSSLGVILGKMDRVDNEDGSATLTLHIDKEDPLKEWLDTIFTKACVRVESEDELLEIHQKALDAGLPSCLITDRGLTQFNGVPTKTGISIGPCYSEDVDKITGHLKLL